MATTHGSTAEHGKDHSKDHAKSGQHQADDHRRSSSHAEEGQKGVTQEQVGSGKAHDPNNFANDRERAAAAGRKGGQHSHDRD